MPGWDIEIGTRLVNQSNSHFGYRLTEGQNMNTGLIIQALGDLTIQQDGEIITDFTYRKAKALLVYLAVERSSTHRRESLYTLIMLRN